MGGFSIISIGNDKNGVYSSELRGEFNTFLIFDGTPEECEEWLEIFKEWPRSEEREQRLRELSNNSKSCPCYKDNKIDDLDLSPFII